MRTTKALSGLLLSIVLSFVPSSFSPVFAAEFHVTTAGEFQAALTEAQANGADDVVYLQAGTYTGSFEFSSAVDEAYALVIQPEPGLTASDVILEGPYSPSAALNIITVPEGRYTVERLTVLGGGKGINIAAHFNEPSLGDVTVVGNIIGTIMAPPGASESSLYVGAKDILVSRNVIENNSSTYNPVLIFPSTDGTVTFSNNIIMNSSCRSDSSVVLISGSGPFTHKIAVNNVITDNIGGGITVYGQGNDTVDFINNTITRNSGTGISIWTWDVPGSLEVTNIYNNISWGNSSWDIEFRVLGYPECNIINAYNNDYHSLSGATWTNEGGNIDVDPLFVDPDNGNYHLSLGSPCVDAGTRDAPELPPSDFEGDARILGLAPDIGADEYIQPFQDSLWNIRVNADDLFHSNEAWLRPWRYDYDDGWGKFEGGYSYEVEWYYGPYTQGSGSAGGLSWHIPPDGNLRVAAPPDHQWHAWTYVYVDAQQVLQIPAAGDCVPKAFVNYDFDTPYTFPAVLTLDPGWNRIDLTGYNQNASFSFDLNYALASNVELMNSTITTEIIELVPTQGGYGTKIKVIGSGFGPQRFAMFDDNKGYYSFVTFTRTGDPGPVTMIATKYPHCARLWSGTDTTVLFKSLFIDQDGDYLQDANEPIETGIIGMNLVGYDVKFNTIWFTDNNDNDTYDEGDTVDPEEVFSSDPVTFTQTDDPVIVGIRPAGGQEAGRVIRIKGYNLGDDTDDPRIVHINNKTYLYPHTRIKLWTPTLVKFKLVNYNDAWFNGEDYRKRKVWVTVGTTDSNTKKIKVLKADAPPPPSGCWCHTP